MKLLKQHVGVFFLVIAIIALTMVYMFRRVSLQTDITETEAYHLAQERLQRYCKLDGVNSSDFTLRLLRDQSVLGYQRGEVKEIDVTPWIFVYTSTAIPPRHGYRISVEKKGHIETSLIPPMRVISEAEAIAQASAMFKEYCLKAKLDVSKYVLKKINKHPYNSDTISSEYLPWCFVYGATSAATEFTICVNTEQDLK